MGAAVRIVGEAETRGTRYALLDTGEAMISIICGPIGQLSSADYVAVAERFEHTPYLWGGVSRLRHRLFGAGAAFACAWRAYQCCATPTCRRRASAARSTSATDLAGLQRGDLVFWKGHVAIMLDAASHHPCQRPHDVRYARDAGRCVARIGHLYGGPTGFRRP